MTWACIGSVVVLGLLGAALVAVVLLVPQARQLLAKLLAPENKGGEIATDVDLPYVASPYFFTPAENSFYQTLRQAVGDRYVIFPKVRLGDVIEVRRGEPKKQSYFNRIQSKHVDFVLCEPKQFRPRVIVELDDSSHDAPRRKERDAFVDKALAAAKARLRPCRGRTHVRRGGPALHHPGRRS